MNQTHKTKLQKSKKHEVMEWVLTLLGAVILASLIRTFIFSPYRVFGRSMEDTLFEREVMLTTKYDYLLGEPSRFDVVICRYPGRTENFVKRVVGIPGDTVAVTDGCLYVNDERCDEVYITHSPNYIMPAYTVKQDEYFVLGDNRSNSNDSHLVGSIKRDQIKAHVRMIIFPFSSMRMIR